MFRRTFSGTTRRTTPSKNANASTCASVHACWSMRSVGQTNRCREQASTITNAHIVRRCPVRRVGPHAQPPVVDLCLFARRDVIAQHNHPVAALVLAHVAGDIPLERGQARLEPLLITQPL